jgi:hypothetical protein
MNRLPRFSPRTIISAVVAGEWRDDEPQGERWPALWARWARSLSADSVATLLPLAALYVGTGQQIGQAQSTKGGATGKRRSARVFSI